MDFFPINYFIHFFYVSWCSEFFIRQLSMRICCCLLLREDFSSRSFFQRSFIQFTDSEHQDVFMHHVGARQHLKPSCLAISKTIQLIMFIVFCSANKIGLFVIIEFYLIGFLFPI